MSKKRKANEMLDIKFIRENPDLIKKTIEQKRLDLDLDKLLELDVERRKIIQELESLRATKNLVSEEIPKLSEKEKKVKILEMQEVDKRTDELKNRLKDVEAAYDVLMLLVPNIPSEDSPIGPDSSANKEVYRWGEPKKFDFEIKDHIALGKELDLIDTESGVKVSGFRGYFLKNEAVLLHLAVIWHAVNKMREKEFSMILPPTLVREFALVGSGHFPLGRDEIYQIGNPGKLASGEYIKDPMFLTGTSESSLLAMYADKILDEKDLPIKICGFSQCYRSEIGSYGKDTHGLYRIHEFMKVEQVVLCRGDVEESDQWLEDMRKIAQEILEELELPYRVLSICTGDMGVGKRKMYDIETWMPSRGDYGETHSDSNLTDWQARRLNIKYKTKDGEKRFVHTLNNTVIASPRILIAILENYQQEDGSVLVPEVLRPYLGGLKVIKR